MKPILNGLVNPGIKFDEWNYNDKLIDIWQYYDLDWNFIFIMPKKVQTFIEGLFVKLRRIFINEYYSCFISIIGRRQCRILSRYISKWNTRPEK